MRIQTLIICVSSLLVLACTEDSMAPSSLPDQGLDVGSDFNEESDFDSEPDAQLDAELDALADAETDAGLDAHPDAEVDSDSGINPDAGLPDGPSSDRHTARPIGTTNAGQGYYEYLPPGYGDGALRPLLLFVHGLGENGNGDSQLDRVNANGPPRLVERDQWPSDRPFIVLSPQHTGGGCTSPAEIRNMLSFAMAEYDVDPARIYLTGLSCGAIGSWNYLRADGGDVVAAAVLIAGDGRSAWNGAGCDLGEVAIWGFHGDADPTVNVAGTNVPIDNLLSDCPSPPRLETLKTIYPGVGHNSWARTYDGSAGHNIYSWLLGKTKP